MKRILTLALLAALGAGCSSTAERNSSSHSCATRVVWQGNLYYGRWFAKALPPSTLTLGAAARPTCRDRLGGEAGASLVVEVRRISGVDPRRAIAVAGESRHAAYVASDAP